MELSEVIFIDNLPKLDLHGFDRDSARVAINDFIRDNIVMKNEVVSIIHGVGTGVIRTTVKDTLSRNKFIDDYKIFFNNRGVTIVKIKKVW